MHRALRLRSLRGLVQGLGLGVQGPALRRLSSHLGPVDPIIVDGLLGVAGIIIDSYCGSFPKIPYV